MDMWKRWALYCHDENTQKFETYYFDTKEEMLQYAKKDGIRVGKMFHLEDVEI